MDLVASSDHMETEAVNTMKKLRSIASVMAAIGIQGCAGTPEKMTLEQAEYQPYGNFVGKDGDRLLHYKWDTADPLVHYMDLAKKVKGLPSKVSEQNYRFKVKSLVLDVGDNQYTIDANQAWLKAMDDGWDDRFNVTYAKTHNATLSGAAALGWESSHEVTDPEIMLADAFPRALARAEDAMNEVDLSCKIQGFSEATQYEQSATYVELYRGVHHFRKYECGDVFVHVLTTVKPDLSATYSIVKVLSDDTKGRDIPAVAQAYQVFKRWNLKDHGAAMSFTADDYSERVTTWYAGKEKTFPMMRRKCPCAIEISG